MISKAGGTVRLGSYLLKGDYCRPTATHPAIPKLCPYGLKQSIKKTCFRKSFLSTGNCLYKSVVNFTIRIFKIPSNQNPRKKPEGDSRFFLLMAAKGRLTLIGHHPHLTFSPLSANRICGNFLARKVKICTL